MKLVDDLGSWCQNHGVKTLTELRGTLRWER
jgi:hypothetical protein